MIAENFEYFYDEFGNSIAEILDDIVNKNQSKQGQVQENGTGIEAIRRRLNNHIKKMRKNDGE